VHVKTHTLRTVIAAEYKETINGIIAEKTDAAPGDPEWIKHYPSAVTAILDGLTDKEMEDVTNKMEEWNATGPTREEQQR
jgi:hypothetical protein